MIQPVVEKEDGLTGEILDIRPGLGVLVGGKRHQKIPEGTPDRFDQLPDQRCGGRPFMVGGVVLDEFTDVIGQDFPVMGFAFGPAEEKIIFFSPFNDCGDRDLLPILLPKQVSDIAVIIGLERDIRVFDQLFF